jgi:hypothetical protein
VSSQTSLSPSKCETPSPRGAARASQRGRSHGCRCNGGYLRYSLFR